MSAAHGLELPLLPELRALLARAAELQPDQGQTLLAAELLWRPHPSLLALRLCTPDQASALLAEVDRRTSERRARGLPLQAPNSMHEQAVLFEELELGGLLLALREQCVTPLARLYFAEHGGGLLYTHHGYLVDYARDKDQELGFHVDDSDLTLNLCLGEDFDGAQLCMLGLRCDLHRQTPVLEHEKVNFAHEPGVALLHAGRQRHQVEPIRRGRRANLILWCKASARRVDPKAPLCCADWCGWRGR